MSRSYPAGVSLVRRWPRPPTVLRRLAIMFSMGRRTMTWVIALAAVTGVGATGAVHALSSTPTGVCPARTTGQGAQYLLCGTPHERWSAAPAPAAPIVRSGGGDSG